MASCSCVPGCGHFLASYDGHDRCPSCLGYQHAEAALVNESCSHCGNMTTAMLRFRYLLAKRGLSPLPCPILAPAVLGGLLRLMVRVTWGSQWELPRQVHLCGPLTPPAHHTIWCSRTSSQGPRTGRGPASRSEHQRMTGCRSLPRRTS